MPSILMHLTIVPSVGWPMVYDPSGTWLHWLYPDGSAPIHLTVIGMSSVLSSGLAWTGCPPWVVKALFWAEVYGIAGVGMVVPTLVGSDGTVRYTMTEPPRLSLITTFLSCSSTPVSLVRASWKWNVPAFVVLSLRSVRLLPL